MAPLGQATYQFQLHTDSSFGPPALISADGLVDPNFVIPSGQALEVGQYFWRVRATVNGVTGQFSAVRNLIIMDPADIPVPALVEPPDTAELDTGTPTFTWGSVIGPTDRYRLQVANGNTFTPPLVINVTTATTSFTPATALNEGEYFWRVRAESLDGETVGLFSETRSFTIVSPEPTPTPTSGPQTTITITSPQNLSVVGTRSITVEGTVSEPSLVVSVIVNGIHATLVGSDWTATNVPLLEGVNVVEAKAIDVGGREVKDIINVTLDTFPPTIAITTEDGLITTESTVDIFGNVHDAVIGTVNVGQVTVTVNGIVAQVSNRTFLATGVPLVPGENVITATAVDRIGNSASHSIRVFREEEVNLRINIFSGNNQEAEIKSLLRDPLVIQMLDDTNSPVADRDVVFRVVQGDGTITSDTVTTPRRAITLKTDAEGKARVFFTLGSRAGSGNNRVKVSSAGVPVDAFFVASGLPKPPDKISISAGNNQQGAVNQPLVHPLVAVVTDEGSNRIEGIRLRFEVVAGGGLVDGKRQTIVTTDSDGRAAVELTLGPRAGFDNNRVQVTYADFPTPFPAVFVASALVPGDPEDTVITGVVLNNSDVPIPGVKMSVEGFSASAFTNDQGIFELTFPPGEVPSGFNHLIADGSTVVGGFFPMLIFEIDVVPGAMNTLPAPIYLLPLDVDNTKFVGGDEDVTFNVPGVPGFTVTVLANSVTFPNGAKTGMVSITQVHSDKVPMVPPDGMQWPVVVTIQPPNVRFNPPAPFTLPNVEGLPPGSKAELFSFDHDLGQFVSVGMGTVSEDGSIIVSDPGFGIVKGGWHGGGSPPPPGGAGGGGGY